MSHITKVAALIGAFLLTSGFFYQEPGSDNIADAYQADIASLVSSYLPRYHYQRYRMDDEMSEKLLTEYIKSLDLSKMYFLKSDIDSFSKYKKTLDDDLQQNPARLTTAFRIFEVFRDRVYERVDYILATIDKAHDFTTDEYISLDRAEAPWAKTKGELDDLWRRRLKEEIIRFKLRDKPEKEYLDILTKRYQRLKKSYEILEPADITERFLASLAACYDPHSTYLRPASKDNFDIEMGHSLEGIGATLTTEAEYTVVSALLEGGPAERSGRLHVNDKIIAVAQGDEEPEDVVDLRIDKVVKKIRGPKGTKVRLVIIPHNAKDQSVTQIVSLVRERVTLTSQDAKAEVKELQGEDGEVLRVGVIEIPSFYQDTRGRYNDPKNYKSITRDVSKLLKDLEEQHVSGVVIDLRRNGGGSLDEAIRLTGLFIDSGPIVQIRDFHGDVQVERDPDPQLEYEGPLVVLTSIFSASASEIFASAMQDYGRAVVIGGAKTHGKGTVQNVLPLQSMLSNKLHKSFPEDIAGALKLTTHKFYRVSGGSTQYKGVEPDLVLPSPYDGMDVTEEDLDYSLPWDEITPIPHKDYGLVQPSLSFLKTNSAKRVSKDPEFRYLREDFEYRKEMEKKNRITLNYQKRLEEKDEFSKRDKARDEERRLRLPIVQSVEKSEKVADDEDGEDSDEVQVPDFILDETLLILRDYITHRTRWVADVSPHKETL